VTRDCEAERRGTRWHKVTFTLDFLAPKGLIYKIIMGMHTKLISLGFVFVSSSPRGTQQILFYISEISLCKPNPCKHKGECRILSQTTYECDCSNTGYQGRRCHIGVAKVPELPQMILGVESDEFSIFAKPTHDVIFTLVADPPNSVDFKIADSPNSVDVEENNRLYLYSPREEVSFSLIPRKTGVIRIKYEMSGTNFMEFQQPSESLILVQPAKTSLKMSGLPTTSLPELNCHQMQLHQCHNGQIVQLKSSCPWKISGSKGFISVTAGNKVNLPFSLAGVTFQNKDGQQTFRNSGLINVARETQNMLLNGKIECDTTGKCKGTNFNKADHDFLLKRNIFLRSYLNRISNDTPSWLSMSLPYYYKGFHVNDVQSIILKDSRVNNLRCTNKPSGLSGVYSAMVLQAPFQLRALGVSMAMQSTDHTCILKSLCDSKTFIAFPKDIAQEVIINGASKISFKVKGFGMSPTEVDSNCCHLFEPCKTWSPGHYGRIVTATN